VQYSSNLVVSEVEPIIVSQLVVIDAVDK